MSTYRKTGIILGAMVLLGLAACQPKSDSDDFTADELALICEALNRTEQDMGRDGEYPAGTMRVLTVSDPADSSVLRAPSCDLSAEALLSEDYENLCSLMVTTVTHPTQDGVGIAGPQVGLNRRVVAVQRFDKEPVERGGKTDYPFEVYPNVRIVSASDSLAYGPEGCLSVPDRRGDVLRSQEIVIEYADMEALKAIKPLSGTAIEEVPMRKDTVKGFTAVIFQHEIDHLEGILYIDRL